MDALPGEGRGWPIIVGGDEQLANFQQAVLGERHDLRSPEDILAAAAGLEHPRDLLAHNAALDAWAATMLSALRPPRPPEPSGPVRDVGGLVGRLLSGFRARSAPPPPAVETMPEPEEREVGAWPDDDLKPPGREGDRVPSVASRLVQKGDLFVQEPLARVHILLIPTDDGTGVPAYLRWGGWNACPPPEYHVAALRAWRGRCGAELVGLGCDVMELRVTRHPATREEALALVREQDAYGVEFDGPLAPYAADLMASPWWFLWWD